MERVIDLLINRIDDLKYYNEVSSKNGKNNTRITEEIKELEKAIKILEKYEKEKSK